MYNYDENDYNIIFDANLLDQRKRFAINLIDAIKEQYNFYIRDDRDITLRIRVEKDYLYSIQNDRIMYITDIKNYYTFKPFEFFISKKWIEPNYECCYISATGFDYYESKEKAREQQGELNQWNF